MRVLFGFMVMAVVLSGCFSSPPRHWQHKSIPSSQWGSDYNRCQRAVERHLGLDTANHADQGLSTYDERMRLYEVGKKQKEMVADCMRKLGYVPIR